jgi:hypothetical protein
VFKLPTYHADRIRVFVLVIKAHHKEKGTEECYVNKGTCNRSTSDGFLNQVSRLFLTKVTVNFVIDLFIDLNEGGFLLDHWNRPAVVSRLHAHDWWGHIVHRRSHRIHVHLNSHRVDGRFCYRSLGVIELIGLRVQWLGVHCNM